MMKDPTPNQLPGVETSLGHRVLSLQPMQMSYGISTHISTEENFITKN